MRERLTAHDNRLVFQIFYRNLRFLRERIVSAANQPESVFVGKLHCVVFGRIEIPHDHGKIQLPAVKLVLHRLAVAWINAHLDSAGFFLQPPDKTRDVADWVAFRRADVDVSARLRLHVFEFVHRVTSERHDVERALVKDFALRREAHRIVRSGKEFFAEFNLQVLYLLWKRGLRHMQNFRRPSHVPFPRYCDEVF